MEDAFTSPGVETASPKEPHRLGIKVWISLALGLVLVVALVVFGPHLFGHSSEQAAATTQPMVTVSAPLRQDIDKRIQILGQFSGVQQVEIRAQVGGTLTQIAFKDGDIVQKGDLLFVIDPEPYEIKMSMATAQLESAKARADLAIGELARAQALKKTDAGSAENEEQKFADQKTAQATLADAQAKVRDAKFDLDHCKIVAPFTGRIGTHLVSVGNLVAGSRAASSPTTLLTTLVSLDPIYLNVDLSESDFMAFTREREKQKGPLSDKVEASLSDETTFGHEGTLDFIDNALDRASGTIHARATFENKTLLMKPGAFARVRLILSPPSPALLVPDASVLADQSQHMILVVAADNTVTSKLVTLGDLRGGLRVIRSGLNPSDKVIIDGMPTVRLGLKVTPSDGLIRFDAAQN